MEGSATGLPAGYEDILSRFVNYMRIRTVALSFGKQAWILEENINSGFSSGLTTQIRSAAKVKITATMPMWRVVARFVESLTKTFLAIWISR